MQDLCRRVFFLAGSYSEHMLITQYEAIDNPSDFEPTALRTYEHPEICREVQAL